MAYGSYSAEADRKPLLNYSESEERAGVYVDDDDDDDSESNETDSMAAKRKGGRKGKKGKKGKKRTKGPKATKGVRITKGYVNLKVRGHKGVQHLRPAELVKYIPKGKLVDAAKKVLKKRGK